MTHLEYSKFVEKVKKHISKKEFGQAINTISMSQSRLLNHQYNYVYALLISNFVHYFYTNQKEYLFLYEDYLQYTTLPTYREHHDSPKCAKCPYNTSTQLELLFQ